ncbi:MAG: glycosyl transferase family 2 [Rickettsiales bacterium]|nr:glycosyl transferase family 2 [Rickettsiales bacterium]RPG14949.1 MAG: glycosyltransferase [Pelagibacteraceae bacterium TMED195]
MVSFFCLIAFCSWLYLLFFNSRKSFSYNDFFWSNETVFERSYKKNNIKNYKKICIVVPARNEEKNIVKTLNSIVRQDLNNISILIIDDNSNDKTYFVASNLLKKKKIKHQIVKGKKLPNGWSGKVWALKQAVDILKKKEIEYYLFLDSDIILKKGIITEAVEFLCQKKLLMVSLMAKLNCSSSWEKILIPAFIYFFQKIYPFSKVNDSKNRLAAAAGGFILCKSEVFSEENLYDQIKDKVIDDCNIAKKIKEKGNIWLGLTEKIYSNRCYTNLSDIWRMISRTAYEQLNFSPLYLCFSIFGMCIVYLYPILVIFFFEKEQSILFLFNSLTILFLIISFRPTVRFYNLSIFYCLSLPLSSLIYIMMTITSAFNFHFRKGNIWKGRKY